MTTQEILEAARGARTAVALSDSSTRDSALLGMADALCAPESIDAILAANAEDMAAAKGRRWPTEPARRWVPAECPPNSGPPGW